jgi:hypothetical protein
MLVQGAEDNDKDFVINLGYSGNLVAGMGQEAKELLE